MALITLTEVLGLSAVYLVYLLIRYRSRAVGTSPSTTRSVTETLPLFGALYHVAVKFADRAYEQNMLQSKDGQPWTATIPWFRMYSCSRPEWIEYFQKTNFQNYVKGTLQSEPMNDILGHGIFATDGQLWHQQRKTTSHIFTATSFNTVIATAIDKHIDILIEVLASKREPFALSQLFNEFTLDTFCYMSFGAELDSMRASKPLPFAAAFDFSQAHIDSRLRNPFWRTTELFSASGKRMRAAKKTIDDYAYNIIDQRESELAKGSGSETDLLGLYLGMKSADASRVDRTQVRDSILNLILAGRDTTAQALSWCFFRLIQQPHLIEPIRQEIDALLGPDGKVTYANYKDLKQAYATFYETLRLHPSVPKNAKQVVNDDQVPAGGPAVKKGDIVFWNNWMLGRSEELWGADALLFKPSRWFDDQGNIIRPNQYVFNAFNAGPRLCLGQNLATYEGIAAIVAIVRRFDLAFAPGYLDNTKMATGIAFNDPLPSPLYQVSLTLPMAQPLMVTSLRRLRSLLSRPPHPSPFELERRRRLARKLALTTPRSTGRHSQLGIAPEVTSLLHGRRLAVSTVFSTATTALTTFSTATFTVTTPAAVVTSLVPVTTSSCSTIDIIGVSIEQCATITAGFSTSVITATPAISRLSRSLVPVVTQSSSLIPISTVISTCPATTQPFSITIAAPTTSSSGALLSPSSSSSLTSSTSTSTSTFTLFASGTPYSTGTSAATASATATATSDTASTGGSGINGGLVGGVVGGVIGGLLLLLLAIFLIRRCRRNSYDSEDEKLGEHFFDPSSSVGTHHANGGPIVGGMGRRSTLASSRRMPSSRRLGRRGTGYSSYYADSGMAAAGAGAVGAAAAADRSSSTRQRPSMSSRRPSDPPSRRKPSNSSSRIPPPVMEELSSPASRGTSYRSSAARNNGSLATAGLAGLGANGHGRQNSSSTLDQEDRSDESHGPASRLDRSPSNAASAVSMPRLSTTTSGYHDHRDTHRAPLAAVNELDTSHSGAGPASPMDDLTEDRVADLPNSRSFMGIPMGRRRPVGPPSYTTEARRDEEGWV
ncbi:uncharacterized protein L969DRAFT_54045 [Mixia osmundae IAM 14324]|uniref:Cytochrome P450 n=1 Tax=Mixia osmundae (strain CBS 9802 / IAM 14324 / JCM 22182 / KY 12970) TaxID=764103 RepID=G7E2H1_MIXOS|nr:uncharacterized protein L969DRAFT_54045 [Mixia osmundae IAM 14324]KEI36902.1 hypothetical protein L969DRAFT_54045 [Mixia osmundae IAM 14324]GAA97031.1 hypothetical protein E5Q_03706 [Mixia osmundae IAM 14324]